jgi:hypothetical protein
LESAGCCQAERELLDDLSLMISEMTLPTASVVIANVKNIKQVSQRIKRSLCAASVVFSVIAAPWGARL